VRNVQKAQFDTLLKADSIEIRRPICLLSKRPSSSSKSPYHEYELEFSVLPGESLSVIRHQRRPSASLVQRLASSIEKMGFLVPFKDIP